MVKKTLNIDLNRVEGDLELALDVEDGRVVDARCIGVMYRGFEQLMIGRSPRDAAVITPRVCGICGTAHLYAATLALEQIWQTPVPPNATLIRNLCLLAEGVQNDLRQSFLMFMVDFCHEKYRHHTLFTELMAAFEPFKGRFHLGALEYSKIAVEVIAIFGGQWPHSSYMLPGGVVTRPTQRRIIEALGVVDRITRWYEKEITGCSLDHWLGLSSADEFFHQLEADQSLQQSAVGIFTRFARDIGLHQVGYGSGHMLSYGVYADAHTWKPPYSAPQHTLRSGFYNAETDSIVALDQQLINEHVRYSWFHPYEGGLHPSKGVTIPNYQPDSDRYTWSKAPRYQKKAVQTGPLAELVIGGEPLTTDLHTLEGPSAWLRQFARLRRMGHHLYHMRTILNELSQQLNQPFFQPPAKQDEVDGQGFGMIEAARGALGHWVSIKEGVVERYQIITPTAWNASPKDSDGQPGHWEQSLIGLELDDPENPLMIGHIVRSHDPCLVCTVHMLPTGQRIRFGVA